MKEFFTDAQGRNWVSQETYDKLEAELEAERAVHRAWLARFGELPQSDAATNP
jgi:hypothetical protein